MTSPNVPVRHLAFFRAASAEREGSNEYQTLLAGLLVLRLLDKRRVHRSEWLPVRHAVEAIDDGPIRRILSDLIDAIGAFAERGADGRMAKLIAYAQMLEHDSLWDPAADAYLTATELAAPDRDLLPLCYLRSSACLRRLGRLAAAADLLRKGAAAAAENNDQFWLLKIRIGVAKLQLHRGDLPAAERTIEAVIADAQAGGFPTLVADAWHDRGLVAYERNQDDLSVEYCYAALKAYVDPLSKLRAMHDLATALSDMGHLHYARTVLSAVRNSPHLVNDLRDLATLNLMRVAMLAGDAKRFDQLRRELAGWQLEARVQAFYHTFVGQGYLKFGRVEEARREFAEAIVVAKAHGVYKVVIMAEELLEATPDERAPQWKQSPPRPSLDVILDEIGHQRGEFAEATE